MHTVSQIQDKITEIITTRYGPTTIDFVTKRGINSLWVGEVNPDTKSWDGVVVIPVKFQTPEGWRKMLFRLSYTDAKNDSLQSLQPLVLT